MVIQHNMSALNANRMLGITGWQLAKTAEKLASGYKINRAADDAAGLSISEKMRKRIRGLDKGMENVEDGISLCQVADGALNEIADMLQRTRELSIKAYNGTNSKSDRGMIQDEISQCINELDRVFETTKFNEIYIFRNGGRVQGDVFHPESYIKLEKIDVTRDIPAWLKINDSVVTSGKSPEITLHPNYLTQQTQDTTGIMKHTYELSDGKSVVKIYFGPRQKGMTADGYQWAGDFIKQKDTPAYKELMDHNHEFYKYISSHLDSNNNYTGWTPTLTDNVSAKLDFSGLTNVNDASELYDKLSELVGTELGFPCGTCDLMESIRFGGKFNGCESVFFDDQAIYESMHMIDLSAKRFQWEGKEYTGYFEAITDAMENPDKAQKTAQLASAIAADLADTTYDVLNGAMKTHYDRAVRDPSDQYSVYIYDYRDADAISANSSVDAHIMITCSSIRLTYEKVVEGGYYTHYDGWDSDQIWIQASDEVGDGMPIYSKYLSAEILKLKDYRVDTYGSEVIWEDETEYQKRYDAWKSKIPEPKAERYTVKVPVLKRFKPAKIEKVYENGEMVPKLISPAEVEIETEERERLRYNIDTSKAGPMPTRNCRVREKYEPSELSLLDDAIATISAVRSYYGAVQNRLEHTYKNNANVHENTTNAESRIRDTDMADEIVRNSMLDILRQAGFSMLSQANQTNRGVQMLLS